MTSKGHPQDENEADVFRTPSINKGNFCLQVSIENVLQGFDFSEVVSHSKGVTNYDIQNRQAKKGVWDI